MLLDADGGGLGDRSAAATRTRGELGMDACEDILCLVVRGVRADAIRTMSSTRDYNSELNTHIQQVVKI